MGKAEERDLSVSVGESYRYEQSVLYRLSRLQRLTRHELESRVAKLGLNIPEHSALLVVSERAPITNADLARASYVSAQTMIVLVSGLEERGLLRRMPLGTGRSLLIELTTAGKRMVAQLEAIHAAMADEIVRGTTVKPEDLAGLLRDLTANVAPPSESAPGPAAN